MAKPDHILLENVTGALRIPILFENRSVLAIDKPAHWLIAPPTWSRTTRNLQAALMDSIQQRDFWAASRNLRYLRFIHRLDAETTGVLLLAKSAGALPIYSRLFETRQMVKAYLAVAEGDPADTSWTCQDPIAPDARRPGRMRLARQGGKPAETRFTVLGRTAWRGRPLALVAARPVTGRTHQIRLHLKAAGCSVLGDPLYASAPAPRREGEAPPRPPREELALRAFQLSFQDPFEKRPAHITAPCEGFLSSFHFAGRAGVNLNQVLTKLS